MNSLERVLAALQGQPSDRPPFLLNLSLYGSRLTGAPVKAHFADPAVFAEGQMAVRETFGPDLLLSPFLVSALGEAFGSRAGGPLEQAPNIRAFAADSASAALRLPLPDVDGHPRLLYLRETIRILARKYEGEVPVIGLLVSPPDLPPLIIGLEAWLDALLFRPEEARALLDRCTDFFVQLGTAMLQDGATALALTANLANRFMVPAEVVTGLSRPALERAFSQIPGPIIVHHGGCPLVPHLADFRGLPQVVGFLVDAGEDLAAARAILGPGPLLLGNLDGPGLADLSPEQVRGLCERALDAGSPDPQFILATSGADVPLETPPDCLQAITEAICLAGGGLR
ncbi:uroporphyrinogen decarboxylase [Geothrix oryzae]|uniref:Uroporphyrinogen decarboxylase n=1 Tax=Geothrix oryzae TaxID=2927975 RepID=A0ABN6UU81_9BACT|nr:uroporphyrinogen decarboxylase family protein [Geothrix oryzae]BDU68309.1 uroporphyrinogen decarboxylase [Geothrix oryzae]